MSSFWLGYFAAVASYFGLGFLLGVIVVIKNLAHFHGGGFQWKRMASHIGVVTVFWPVAIAELFGEQP